MANIVIWETYCVLNCDYCMYTKDIRKIFSEKELSTVSGNVSKIKKFIDNYAKKIQVISLTWWEPTLFPDIIKTFYDKFDNKIIRVCTNGLLLNNELLDSFSPERLYFAVTLDWIDLEDNLFRFKSQVMLDKIISNIDLLLNRWFSVEILTVLSPQNMLKYTKLIEYFENKYHKYIENWKIWFIPIELVNYMNLDKFKISDKMKSDLVLDLMSCKKKSIILSRQKEYFDELISYYSWNSVNTCGMYKRALHLKYLGDSIRTKWSFNLYWCWSRWHLMMWTMNFNNSFDASFILERRETKSVKLYFKESDSACKKCFDNRHYYWLILKNKLHNVPHILKKTIDLYHNN